MTAAFGRTIPILRIFSVEKMREFYVGFLAFEVDWEHRFEPDLPLYVQVSRGETILHLSEHHGDACPGAAVLIDVAGIETFQAELAAKRYGYARPGIERAAWGARIVQVTDPFGNRLTFAERDRAPSPIQAS